MITSLFARRIIIYFLLTVMIWIPIFIGMTFAGIPEVAFAQEEQNAEATFATSYDVIYDVENSGVTTVTEKITLRNLTSEYYASEFRLTIGATDIFDIVSSDGGGPLEVKAEKKDASTSINVKFNRQVAGKDKTLPWTLQFKSRDFAEKIGKVWEVRAPRISSTSNLEEYNLTISVPTSFGEPTLISPVPKGKTVSGNKLFLTFSKDQLQQAGVSANFGTVQIFDFDLRYHLENKNLVPILTNIALPPETAYQDVVFARITPNPLNVTIDEDGNFLAWYKLQRGERMDIKVLGSAKLYTNSKVKNPTLSDSLRKKYTQAQKYWETDNPQITSALEQIFPDPVSSQSTEKIKKIYDYVVNTLKYSASRLNEDIERLGAVTALNNPEQAVCMEFTDLFIALARAAGIPARELDGYAYTANPSLRPLSLSKDILHAWGEYWDDDKGWIMVDPTWENTTGGVDYFNKLDLNHFTFAIKGSSSIQPVPAGSYKYDDQDSEDVKILLSENDFLGKPQLDIEAEVADSITSGLGGKVKLKITNLGNSMFASSPISVTTNKLGLIGEVPKTSGPIPAFGSATFEFNLRTKSIFDSYNDQITISVGTQKFIKDITVEPFVLLQPIPFIISGLILASILTYLVVLVTLLYRRRIKSRA